jgi:hypothetical protein
MKTAVSGSFVCAMPKKGNREAWLVSHCVLLPPDGFCCHPDNKCSSVLHYEHCLNGNKINPEGVYDNSVL